jgi:hypothetical protein
LGDQAVYCLLIVSDHWRDVGFFFGNPELSLELWTVIAGISGFDD